MSLRRFYFYDPATGLFSGNSAALNAAGPEADVQAFAQNNAPQGFPVYEADAIDPKTQYMVGGVLTARPASAITSAMIGLVVTLSGVRMGTVVHIAGDAALDVMQDDQSGSVQLTFSTPGSYSIAASQPPEQDFTLQVTL